MVPWGVADMEFDASRMAHAEPDQFINFDSFLTFYKGVAAGALAGWGISEAMYFSTEEYSFFYDESFLGEDPLPEGQDISIPEVLCQLYMGHEVPTFSQMIRMEQPSGEGCVLVTDINVAKWNYAFTHERHDYGVMIIAIQAEGGPPQDVFIFKVKHEC